jgi:hypothetical protein
MVPTVAALPPVLLMSTPQNTAMSAAHATNQSNKTRLRPFLGAPRRADSHDGFMPASSTRIYVPYMLL